MAYLRRAALVFLVLCPVLAFAQTADLEIVSAADAPDPITPGGALTYTVTLTNHGPDAAPGGGVNINLSGAVTHVNSSGPAGFTCNYLGNNGTCNMASLPVGTYVITVNVTVNAGLAAFPDQDISSVFFPSGTAIDNNSSNNSKTATTTVNTQQVDLSLTVTDNPDPVGPDQTLTYTVPVTNSGPDVATSVNLNIVPNSSLAFQSVTAPAGWNCTPPAVGSQNATFTCSKASMAVGTENFTVVFAVNDEHFGIHETTFQTNFNVFAGGSDETDDGLDNSETESTFYQTPDADIILTASDSPDPVAPDGDITYTVTVQNAGPDTAPNVTLNVPMNNTLRFQSVTTPAGWTCTPPAVGAGTSWSCSIASLPVQPASVFTIVLRANDEQFGIFDQTIVQHFGANSSIRDPDNTNNSVNVTTQYSTADANLAITASDAPDPVTNGQNVTFTINVTNGGPDAAPNAHMVAAPHPSLVYQSHTAPAGWSCTTPAVGNAGVVDCSTASLANGGTAEFTVVTKLVAAGSGGTLNSNFTTNSSVQDPDQTNNSVEVFTNWIGQTSDLAITKDTLSTAAAQGSTITYTISTANNGPDDASNVTVTDVLPPQLLFQSITAPAGWSCTTPAAGTNGTITCTIATFVNGGTAQFTLVTTVAPDATGSIANSATIGSSTASDPNGGNSGGASGAVVVAGTADLGVSKGTNSTTATPGGTVIYTITLTNFGPDPAASVVMTDTLPSSLLFQSIDAPAGWNCTTPAAGATGTVTCTASTLAANAPANFTLTTTVANGASGNITNTAAGSHSGTDGNAGNSQVTSAPLPVVIPAADLGISKGTNSTSAAPGDTVIYTITLTNFGPDAAPNATMTDTLPASLLFQSIDTPAGWNCTTPAAGATGTITCTTASFAANASVNFNLTTTVASGATGTITNTATGSHSGTDGNPTNSTVTTSPIPVTTPAAVADLAATKTTATTSASVGQNYSYTITITNNGPDAASNVVLTDTLPSSLLFQSLTPAAGFTCTTPAVGATGTITCTAATLANGATAAFTLGVQVAAGATGTIVNSASVTATEDAATGNNNPSSPGVIVVGGPSEEAQIPTLSEWALIALMAMLALAAALRIRS